MISIQSSSRSEAKFVIPNVLPCEIAYTGKANANAQLWNPRDETIVDVNGDSEIFGRYNAYADLIVDKTAPVAYFRGRKLLGRTTKIPQMYRGSRCITGISSALLTEIQV